MLEDKVKTRVTVDKREKVYYLSINPDAPNEVYAKYYGGDWNLVYSRTLVEFYELYAEEDVSDIVLARTNNGILMSKDGGKDWQPIDSEMGWETACMCLAKIKKNSNKNILQLLYGKTLGKKNFLIRMFFWVCLMAFAANVLSIVPALIVILISALVVWECESTIVKYILQISTIACTCIAFNNEDDRTHITVSAGDRFVVNNETLSFNDTISVVDVQNNQILVSYKDGRITLGDSESSYGSYAVYVGDSANVHIKSLGKASLSGNVSKILFVYSGNGEIISPTYSNNENVSRNSHKSFFYKVK